MEKDPLSILNPWSVHRKGRVLLRAILLGILVAALVGGLLYLMNQSHHF
jgi:hypothetical protein